MKMYRKRLFSYFNDELTFLQNQEVELARKDGLSEKQIQLFASGEYNFLQMQEIRQILCENPEKKSYKYFLNSDLNYIQIREIGDKVKNHEKLHVSFLSKKIVGAFLLITIMLFVMLFVPIYTKPSLYLKQDIVKLSQGESFYPMKYIYTYSGKGKLILPNVVDTNKKGNQIVVYRLITKEKKIEKILLIKIE